MKTFKKIPKFRSENEEAEFWGTHDFTDYFDLSKAKRVIFPNLKRTSRAVPIKLPLHTIDQLKYLANGRNISYQDLIRGYLERDIAKDMQKLLSR